MKIKSIQRYDFDEFTKAGGYIRLLNPELGDDVCIIEDSDFLDTDKTFADIFPNMEHLKLYYIDNLAYSIDEITEGLIIKQSKVQKYILKHRQKWTQKCLLFMA